jgi:hypothetical protein
VILKVMNVVFVMRLWWNDGGVAWCPGWLISQDYAGWHHPNLSVMHVDTGNASDRQGMHSTARECIRPPGNAFNRQGMHSTARECIQPPGNAFNRQGMHSTAFHKEVNVLILGACYLHVR